MAYESLQRGTTVLNNNAFPAWSIIQSYIVNWARAYALTCHYDSYVVMGYNIPKPSKLKHVLKAPMPEIFLCAIREVLRPQVTPDGRMLFADPDTIFLPDYSISPDQKIRNGGIIGLTDPELIRYGIEFHPGLAQSIFAVFKGVKLISDVTREGLAPVKASFSTSIVSVPDQPDTTLLPEKFEPKFNDKRSLSTKNYEEKVNGAKRFTHCDLFIHDFVDECEATVQFTQRLLKPMIITLPERPNIDAIGPPVIVPCLQFFGKTPYRESLWITTHAFYSMIQSRLEGDYTTRHSEHLMSLIMSRWSDDLRDFYWPTLNSQLAKEPAEPFIGNVPGAKVRNRGKGTKKIRAAKPTGHMAEVSKDTVSPDNSDIT